MIFLKQETDYDCTPISICNCLIWAGMSFKKVKNLYLLIKELCETNPEGTDDERTNSTLKIINKRYKIFKNTRRIQYINKQSIEYILNALKQENCCILLGHLEIWEEMPEWHNSLWFMDDSNFIGINAHQKYLYCQLNKKHFKKLLLKGDKRSVPSCWILQKK